jgi:hypothetical protein
MKKLRHPLLWIVCIVIVAGCSLFSFKFPGAQAAGNPSLPSTDLPFGWWEAIKRIGLEAAPLLLYVAWRNFAIKLGFRDREFQQRASKLGYECRKVEICETK